SHQGSQAVALPPRQSPGPASCSPRYDRIDLHAALIACTGGAIRTTAIGPTRRNLLRRNLPSYALGMRTIALRCAVGCGAGSMIAATYVGAAAGQGAPVTQAASVPGTAAVAHTTMKDAQGRTLGEVTLREGSGGVLIKADL